MLAAVAAQDASTSAATTATTDSSVATGTGVNCTPEMVMKATENEQKCLKEKGFNKCLTDAGMDAKEVCSCYGYTNECGSEVRMCQNVRFQTPEQREAAVAKCVMTTKCSAELCGHLIGSSSALVVSLPVLVTVLLSALVMI